MSDVVWPRIESIVVALETLGQSHGELPVPLQSTGVRTSQRLILQRPAMLRINRTGCVTASILFFLQMMIAM